MSLEVGAFDSKPKHSGFALRSSAGWLLSSNARKIQATVRFALNAPLSFAPAFTVEAQSQGLCPQPPNPSFNGTPYGAR